VQGGGGGAVTLTLAITSEARLLAALLADACTEYAPGLALVGTATL
jgi:hypothetical protein